MVDIAEGSAMVAAVGVIVGVVFTLRELRSQVERRQTEPLDCIRLLAAKK